MAQVRLPSGEVRYVRENCKATIGQVGNTDWANIQIGKAGRKRHMGWRPTVRGSVMNPNDHPHGGEMCIRDRLRSGRTVAGRGRSVPYRCGGGAG